MPTNHVMPFLLDLGLIMNTSAEVGMYLGIQLPYEFAQMTVVIGKRLVHCLTSIFAYAITLYGYC